MFLISFFFLISLVCAQDFTSKQNTLCWCEDKKLEWKDFQRPPDSTEVLVGSPALAVTSSSITILTSDDEYKVRVSFDCSKSWTKTEDESVLVHEQVHFDITELFGRKIRRHIELAKNDEVKSQTIALKVEELLDSLNKYQEEYDKATLHGAIDFMQKEWNEKVKREMEELKEYASTSEDCR